MTLTELLDSLTDQERNFISAADYARDVELHRKALDLLISRRGVVDMPLEYWYPYEVIELSKHHPSRGHEREFAACLGIVITNVLSGADNRNDFDWLRGTYLKYGPKLPSDLAEMLSQLLATSDPSIPT
jgi:hypothetical protein